MIKVTKIVAEYADERGEILNLVEGEISSVLLITSKAGSLRANHYHKHDSHYVYVLSGKMEYFEKELDKPSAKLEKIILSPGRMVFTPPMKAHAMKFLTDTVFLAITTRPRGQAAYEADTTRIALIE